MSWNLPLRVAERQSGSRKKEKPPNRTGTQHQLDCRPTNHLANIPLTMSSSSSSSSYAALVVICRRTPDSLQMGPDGTPIIDPTDQANDALDRFNHPRERRALILLSLQAKQDRCRITFQSPTQATDHLDMYRAVHTSRLIDFLTTSWKQWDALGESGQDPGCTMVVPDAAAATATISTSPPLIPICVPLPREPHQRPSYSVMGQVGFFCTDTCTPIFADLLQEMEWDAAVVMDAVKLVSQQPSPSAVVAYAIPTHPGHHAAQDSFGGYCYVNHAALAAHLLSTNNGSTMSRRRVAVLDIDYHCGNGTASIFYDNPHILVVSIHCDPDYDYPFHSGFADETGTGEGVGTTLHLPLPPQTSWPNGYRQAIDQAMKKIVQDFGAEALVVSMGLDTLKDDPCAIRRAGFLLQGNDYWEMGQAIGNAIHQGVGRMIPTVFLQEGGYKMDQIGDAAANVVTGYCAAF